MLPSIVSSAPQGGVPAPVQAAANLLSSRRAKFLATDFYAGIELDKMRAGPALKAYLEPPAGGSVASIKAWYPKATAPEFERLNNKYLAVGGLASRLDSLLKQAGEALGTVPLAGRCPRRNPERAAQDGAFKLHEGVLRLLASMETDASIISQRTAETLGTFMQLGMDQDACGVAPDVVHNPWDVGPKVIVVGSPADTADLQALLKAYSAQLAVFQKSVDTHLGTLRRLHGELDALLTTTKLAYQYDGGERLARMRAALHGSSVTGGRHSGGGGQRVAILSDGEIAVDGAAAER